MALGTIAAALCPVASSASAGPASGPASAAPNPKIYFDSGPRGRVAFKVEGPRVFVLSLSAEVFCSFLEPREPVEVEPSGAFPLATPMRERHGELVATEAFDGGGAIVHARRRGETLVGEFSIQGEEDGLRCQSGSYAGESSVGFRAVRYVPAADPTASPPDGQPPIYFGDTGPIETFIRTSDHTVSIRGTLRSPCPSGAPSRRPLFESVLAKRDDSGHFRLFEQLHPPRGSGVREEKARIEGAFEGGQVTGNYRRSAVTAASHPAPRRCATGPLPFRAVRYLPRR
jgi:hypothetical protein